MYKIIGHVVNLKLLDDGKPFNLDGFLIVDNKVFIDTLFSEIIFKSHIGYIGYSDITEHPVIAYVQNIELETFQKQMICMRVTHDAINIRLHALWFLRDNAVSAAKIYFHYKKDEKISSTENDTIAYSSHTFDVSNASGKNDKMVLIPEDIVNLMVILPKIIEYCTVDSIDKGSLPKAYPDDIVRFVSGTMNQLPYNINRVKRAMIMLNFARQNYFLPAKIFFYIAIIECLFKTNKNSVEAQIKDRVPKYLKTPCDQISAQHDLISQGYEIRSTFVHARDMKEENTSYEEWVPISLGLDELLRKILLKVIDNPDPIFLKEADEIKEFFS